MRKVFYILLCLACVFFTAVAIAQMNQAPDPRYDPEAVQPFVPEDDPRFNPAVPLPETEPPLSREADPRLNPEADLPSLPETAPPSDPYSGGASDPYRDPYRDPGSDAGSPEDTWP